MPEEKNKKEGEGLLGALLTAVSSRQLLKAVLERLQQEQNLQLPELIKTFQEIKKEVSIPLPIFSHSLEPAEALYKFLKENEGFSYKKIAGATKRDQRSVWATYQRARKKKKQKFLLKEEQYIFPLSIFKNRSYSLLESVVFYANTVYNLSNPQIAKLLHKSPNSIAVLMKRARDKHGPQ